MRIRLFVLFSMILFISCSDQEIVPKAFYAKNDHEAYWHSLEQANLGTTALGTAWKTASESVFKQQMMTALPYEESLVLTSLQPQALGYRFEVKRGQKIMVDVSLLTKDTTKVFVDLFRIENDSLSQFLHVASADSTLQLGFEPRKNASYLLRLQPELLRGGHFSIRIHNTPTFDFPVLGKNKKAIQSVFGDPRDGGKRDHHGVDIFAKRHTPIIAPIDGQIRTVGTKKLGGNVVWLYDRKKGHHLYFAHLQEQLVASYDMVSRGDTIGTVGNTGNAKYTPPHLHFGIYKNGPIDPYHFIAAAYELTSSFEPDTLLLGKEFQVDRNMVLKSQMRKTAVNLDTLQALDRITVMAVNHQYVRVLDNHGVTGFLNKKDFSHLAAVKDAK
jgi:murein DD-endopeptidase MepM/ murein hydrolase activator NlpD